ncbi:MAG: hypothetical protein AB3N63_04855 [Puniceicoccaceae bacterium]
MENTSFKEVVEASRSVQMAQPEFIRIPRPKERDPVFGQSRAFWYKAEANGHICFKRFRMSGQRNGITVIPVSEAREMFQILIEAGGGN